SSLALESTAPGPVFFSASGVAYPQATLAKSMQAAFAASASLTSSPMASVAAARCSGESHHLFEFSRLAEQRCPAGEMRNECRPRAERPPRLVLGVGGDHGEDQSALIERRQ